MAERTTEGGCFCGAIRYRLEGPPVESGYCHCRMCQRAVGAPVVPWATWPSDRLTWLEGEPRVFRSSPKGERTFCSTCGTSLTFLDPTEPEIVDVSLASLDDPEAFPPEHHIWTSSRVRWLDLADDLPRYGEARSS